MSNNYFLRVKRGVSFSPQSGPPTTAKKGDLYFDGTTNKVRVYVTDWTDVGSGGVESVNYYDPNPYTSLPSLSSYAPDGATTIQTGDKVLFSGLSGGIAGDDNKIQIATVSGGSVSWSIYVPFVPNEGVLVSIENGDTYGAQVIKFDGTSWDVLVTLAEAQTLTNKTIKFTDNTIQAVNNDTPALSVVQLANVTGSGNIALSNNPLFGNLYAASVTNQVIWNALTSSFDPNGTLTIYSDSYDLELLTDPANPLDLQYPNIVLNNFEIVTSNSPSVTDTIQNANSFDVYSSDELKLKSINNLTVETDNGLFLTTTNQPSGSGTINIQPGNSTTSPGSINITGGANTTANNGGSIYINGGEPSDLDPDKYGIIYMYGKHIDVGTRNIKELANPISNQDAATKQYVDAYYSGSNTSLASGAQITLQSGRIDQIFTVISSSGGAISLSTTPFTVASPGTIYNGTTIMLIGKSVTATVQLTHNDAVNGCVLNGNAVLGLNDTITLRYVGDRYYEVSRNF